MIPFGVVELQRLGQRIEDRLSGVRDATLLEADVVVHADAGEQSEFLATQSGNATGSGERGYVAVAGT